MNKLRRARSNEQRMERREELLQAAWHLFQKRDFSKINIAEIAQQAGVAKGTVYLYFPTKDELFIELLEQELAAWLDTLNDQLPDLSSNCDIQAVSHAITASLHERGDMVRLFTIAHTTLEKNISYPAALKFHRILLDKTITTGAHLETCFPWLKQSQGASLMLRIYALIIGLYQLAHPALVVRAIIARESGLSLFNIDFENELEDTIHMIFTGASTSPDFFSGQML